MKKTLLSVIMSAAVLTGFAQKEVGTVQRVEPISMSADRATDTLVSPAVFINPTLYGAAPGGYILGTNGYSDKVKAQRFLVSLPTIVEEVLFWFGGKTETSGDPTSAIGVNVYSMDGNGTSTAGAVTDAPGTILSTSSILISDADTAGDLSIAMLPSPIWVNNDFAAGMSSTTLAAGDTVGLVSSLDGEVEYGEFCWEQWSDDTWYTLPAAGWGGGTLDLDAGIFVVVDNSTIGIDEEGSFNNMRLSFLNGNIVENGQVAISYDVTINARMDIMIHDATGKMVHQADLGNKAAGNYNYSVAANGWNAGSYYMTLRADGEPLTTKFQVR